MRRLILSSALLAALLCSNTARTAPSPTGEEGGRDAGAPGGVDAGVQDPCAAQADRLARRKAWLAERRQEQFEKGGPPNPELAIPNMVHLFCETNPDHEECQLGSVAIELTSEELTWREDSTPEDLDPHVVLMKRALQDCRARQRRR